MKKILFSAVILLALAFASCNKGELEPIQENIYTYTIKASINNFGTKTTMYGNTVNWEDGDNIALFANDGSKIEFTLSEGAGTSVGTFGTTENIEGKTFVAALYPYDAQAVYSNGIISTNIAKEHTWIEGKNNKAIMAATVTSSDNITFKNAGAVIALSVNNIPAGYNKIELSSTVAVNGSADISFTDNIPVSNIVSNADENKTISINFPKSVANTNKVFYFPLGVTTNAAAVTVTLWDGTTSQSLVDNYAMANAIRNTRYYKTINFDANGNLPVQLAGGDDINAKIDEGITNFILHNGSTGIEITSETIEELQIAVTSTGNSFTLNGTGARGKINLSLPDNTKELVIDVPNATVEIKPDAGVATFNTITASTAENTLVVPFGVTVNNLKVTGGNVRISGNVKSITNAKESGKVAIYKEEGANIPSELDTEKFEVIDYSSNGFVQNKEELIAAVANATDGATISLGKDIEDLTDILVIEKAITLDGGNHTITSSAGRCINVSGVSGNVTIKNLNIVANGERAINIIQNSKNITIENVKAASSNYTVNVASSAPNATISIKNSDLTGLNTINIAGVETSITVNDTRIACNDKTAVENYGAISIGYGAAYSTVDINNGIMAINDNSYAGVISASGGNISFNGTKGNTHVERMKFVIDYGNSYYYALKTFEEALELAKNGETIKVIDNIAMDSQIIIPAGKVTVLDLNGFTISQEKECTAHYEFIRNNGTLTIKDTKASGKITFKDTGNGDSSFGWGSYTIGNYGTLTVENGTIENTTQLNTTSAVHMYCAIHQGWGAVSTTINGGQIKNETYRTVRINNGTLTINGGKFEGQIWMHPFDDNTSITIGNGDFSPRGVDGSSVYVENGSRNVGLSVTGGTFNTKIGCAQPTKDGVKGKITGGKFSETAKAGTNVNLFATGGTWSGLTDGFYTFTAN